MREARILGSDVKTEFGYQIVTLGFAKVVVVLISCMSATSCSMQTGAVHTDLPELQAFGDHA